MSYYGWEIHKIMTSLEYRYQTTKVMLAGLKSQLERCHHFGDFPTVIRHLLSRESRQLKRTCVLFKLSPNVLSLCNVFEVHMAKYILKHQDQFIFLTFISKRHCTKQDYIIYIIYTYICIVYVAMSFVPDI